MTKFAAPQTSRELVCGACSSSREYSTATDPVLGLPSWRYARDRAGAVVGVLLAVRSEVLDAYCSSCPYGASVLRLFGTRRLRKLS